MIVPPAKRILVIDDDEDVLDILRIALSGEGVELVFSNTDEALTAIDNSCPDLILLDVHLQGSSAMGAEMCNKLKQRHVVNHMPLIMVSEGSDLQGLASACNADLFISKPFDIFQLLVHVKRFLN